MGSVSSPNGVQTGLSQVSRHSARAAEDRAWAVSEAQAAVNEGRIDYGWGNGTQGARLTPASPDDIDQAEDALDDGVKPIPLADSPKLPGHPELIIVNPQTDNTRLLVHTYSNSAPDQWFVVQPRTQPDGYAAAS